MTQLRKAPLKGTIAGAACLTLLVLILSLRHLSAGSDDAPALPQYVCPPPGDSSIGPGWATREGSHERSIANLTLGFEKIMVVNLPERTDRRDGAVLAASLSGLHLDFVPGVRTEDMSEKAFPHRAKSAGLPPKGLGAWRAHMNAIASVVSDGLSSALILEDDVDWDVHVHEQLRRFAEGVHVVLNTPVGPETTSPYGDGWDVLWLGHCGETIFPDHSTYRIADDDTMPDADHLDSLANHPNWEAFPPASRFVHVTGDPVGSFGYAVSRAGAQKLMYHLELDRPFEPFDMQLRSFCSHVDGARCVSATPGYFNRHRSAGPEAADSDLESYGGDGSVRTTAYTELVKYSVRLNLDRLLRGEAAVTQWPDGA
ncbi:MAG: hypothetical protein M1832_002753 [Thelocarpon impressellum]|nr:MAG: hypothetical protein M1832_002753 [Thelocarpon impressellum]